MQDIILILKKYFANSKKYPYVILFGSATKKLRKNSDIDIFVGKELKFTEQIKISQDLELKFKRRVDVVCLNNTTCEVIMDAFSKGVQVVVNNREKMKRDYFKKFYEYDDNTNLRRIKLEYLKKEFANG